jgi:uncharacterized membrane protein YjjP (DUF1212 family)
MLHLVGLIAAANPGTTVGNNLKNLAFGFIGAVFLVLLAFKGAHLFAVGKWGQLAVLVIVALIPGMMIYNSLGFSHLLTSMTNALLSGV